MFYKNIVLVPWLLEISGSKMCQANCEVSCYWLTDRLLLSGAVQPQIGSDLNIRNYEAQLYITSMA